MVKETIERYSIRAAGHADNYSCDACVQYLTEMEQTDFQFCMPQEALSTRQTMGTELADAT